MWRSLCTRRRFHGLRLLAWTAQLPLIAVDGVRESVPYLVFLSLAALIESALTDYDQARQADKSPDGCSSCSS